MLGRLLTDGRLPGCLSSVGASFSESDSLKSKTDVSDEDLWLEDARGGNEAEVGGNAPTGGTSESALAACSSSPLLNNLSK